MSIGGFLIALVIFRIFVVQQKQLWLVDAPYVHTPAVVADDTIFFGTIEGLYCVQAETGVWIEANGSFFCEQ